MNITRRAALRGTAAVATCAVAGSAVAAASDADLITWEAEILDRVKRCQGVQTDEELETICGPIEGLEWLIARAEARTARGLAVKFRRHMVGWEDGEGNWDEENIRTILASFERLVGEGLS